MSGSEKMARGRWLAITLVVLLLVVLAGYSNVTLGSTPKYTYGDIPLDPATYEKYLQVMPDRAGEALPPTYDARNDGIVTSAKNQGDCGGCWAFASVGAMESHLQKEFSFGLKDLSEQQLLSCNASGYDCGGGSSDAPRYWENDGPIYETCFAYQANDSVPCSNAAGCARLDYRVTNWHTVASNQFRDSLYYDGPGYWRFDVYSDFASWWDNAAPGAVYVNGSGTDLEGGHAVLLIGWSDAKGAYLCKNSWGASGGPQGDGTFWIAYSGHYHDLRFGMSNFDLVSLSVPPDAPSGLTAAAVSPSRINLTWTDNSEGESGFKIERSPNGSTGWGQIATVGAGVTTYPNTGLSSGMTYYYRVRAYNTSGDSAYSNSAHATTPSADYEYWAYLPAMLRAYGAVECPMDSQFNGSAANWWQHSGDWYYDSNYLFTYGLGGSSSSASYDADFYNLDYQASMLRYGCDTCANRIIFRGTPYPLSDNNWYSFYLLQYARDGYYSVFKRVTGGDYVALVSWTETSAIHRGDAWNTLRVVANGTSLSFYINGTHLWSGVDSSLSHGRAGVGMYQDFTVDNELLVDWARLCSPGAASLAEPQPAGEGVTVDGNVDQVFP